jgi:8-oxo-dGTP diphosphatase
VNTASSGGYVRCARGCTHWGPHGAAGLLIRHQAAAGPLYLLQFRAPWVHHGRTWSIPGGALRPGETPTAGARREAMEELGGLPQMQPVHTHTVDHGGWAYHTIVVDSPRRFTPDTGDSEGLAYRWASELDLPRLNLHPGLASAWTDLRAGLGRRAA